MNEAGALAATNIHFVEQGISLLDDISDDLYVNVDSPHHKSGVGRHMRHVLEHYIALLSHSEGRVDYDARKRDEELETDRLHAISVAQQVAGQLEALTAGADQKLLIKNNEIGERGDYCWSRSSFGRELQFMISHTVHHYALIAIILRIQGYTPDEYFGVAPSTLRYETQLQDRPTG
ncbi:DinB family protein [Halalkalibaculum sp. DA3122]|uniref:DinB family protein n=1 Tax=unclassified Halalkalibaculum TaxID=2964617 RepID=UPI003753FE2E